MLEITLAIKSERDDREVRVANPRFTIGRSPDNDLVINDPSLSRRHAVLESLGDSVVISDCGSHNGIYVNGLRAPGAFTLTSGDVISLGACDLTIRINPTEVVAQQSREIVESNIAESNIPSHSPGGEQAVADESVGQLPPRARSRPLAAGPIIAAAAIAFIVIGALVLVVVSGGFQGKERNINRAGTTSGNQTSTRQENRAVADSNVDRNPDQRIAPGQIERGLAQVMRRISSDDKPYVFPADVIGDLSRRIDEYRRSSSIAGALRSLNQQGADIAASARREGIEPGLVVYTALAETNGGARRDPSSAARQVLPALAGMRPHFGCDLADCALIMVAAYRIDPGTRRSHPLLPTMRRLVRNPLTERNVWHLHERGGIDEATYSFVLDFIAYAVIAQNPGQFGITADAPAF